MRLPLTLLLIVAAFVGGLKVGIARSNLTAITASNNVVATVSTDRSGRK